jgi:hypothetical protein
MARGPKGEKRPGDVNARAVMIAKIATGEIKDVTTVDGKNAAAVALGRMGGKARAAALGKQAGGNRPKSCRNPLEIHREIIRVIIFVDLLVEICDLPATSNHGVANGRNRP